MSDPEPPQDSTEKADRADSDGLPSTPPKVPDHTLLKPIGRGSYGEVWLAQNIMGEFRAVKIVHRRRFKDKKPYERELAGIRKFAPISRTHEGFIHVLHAGINEEAGYFYYVMELGDDQSSNQEIVPSQYVPATLSRQIAQNGPLALGECVKLGIALSRALHELHIQGLVHRDVKPSNIIFVNGFPKLADIGLVTDVDAAFSYVGTEGFIPPEGPGTARADIFGLGKTLYEISTGKDRHDFPEFPTALDQIPNKDGFLELNEVVLRACKHDPKARYGTAEQMHMDLVVIASGKSILRLRLLERRFKRIKRLSGSAFLGVLLAGSLFRQSYIERKTRNELRQRQVGADIAYGNRAMGTGDLLGALPFFAEALALDSDNKLQQRNHRLRIGSILAQCPKLTFVWSDGQRINHAEISPDGQRLLIAEFQGSLRLRKLDSGEIHSRSFGSNEWLWTAGYSPDGKVIATANGDGVVHLLDGNNLAEKRSISTGSPVNSLAFSPDGWHLATGCRDGLCRIFGLGTNNLNFVLNHGAEIRSAAYSPNGSLIATGGKDGVVDIWESASGGIQAHLTNAGWINCCAFSPDGGKLVAACTDHKARVWDIASHSRILPDLNSGDSITSSEFSPDGRVIVTASLDGTARLWSVDSLQPLNLNPIIRHNDRLMYAGFARNGCQLVMAGTDGTTKVWDFAGISTEPTPIPFQICDDGSKAFLLRNGTLEITDPSSGKSIGPSIKIEPNSSIVAINTTGHFVATVTSTHDIQLWDSTVKMPMRSIAVSNRLSGVRINETGSMLAGYHGKSLQLWNIAKGSSFSIAVTNGDISGACFNPKYAQILTINGDQIMVWDTETTKLAFSPLQFDQAVHSAEFSKDGSKIIGCCWDWLLTKCYAQVWNAENGQPIGPPLMQGDGVLSASFNPDGKHVVTASEDFTAIVWDSETGKRLIAPVEHEEKVRTGAFSPDGRFIATASADKTARVWNAETGDPLTPPLQHLLDVTNARFLSDGFHLITADMAGDRRVWEMPIDGRPIEDILSISRLLGSHSETRFGPLTASGTNSLESAWRRLRTQYGASFTVTENERIRWHEYQLRRCEREKNISGEAFHLHRLLNLCPNDLVIKNRLSSLRH